jgi:FkbM family methyltransferase
MSLQPLRYKNSVYSAEQCRVIPWTNIDGDNTLRLNYELDANSLVYDVGGYEGTWAENIYKKYKSNIEIFEPVKKFANKIEEKFAAKPKVHTYTFGLAEKNYKTSMKLDGASSTTHKTSRRGEHIQLVSAKDFIKEHNHKRIDLVKINIEGGEYPLLDHFIKTGLVNNIEDIQVQFHVFVPDAPKKRKELHDRLSKTHYLTYSYPWLWENWKRKK